MRTSILRWGKRGAIGIAALLVLGLGIGTLTTRRTGSDAPGAIARRVTSTGGGGTNLTTADAAVAGLGAGEAYSYSANVQSAPARAEGGSLPGLPDRVVRSADLSIRVPKKSLDAAWNNASRIATRFGGYVLSGSRGNGRSIPVAEDEADLPASGDLTIRVPAAKFEEAMAELRKLGVVLSDTVTSQDVTQEFVDLESRLRNQRSQQAVLIRLMGQAKNVGETLAVQQQLSQVQEQIEQITGRLNVLKTLTSMSTISMHVFEPGAAGAPVPPDEGPSFGKAWDTAMEGLLRIGTVAMIAALWLAPFAILAAVALAFRRTRPGTPAGAETATP